MGRFQKITDSDFKIAIQNSFYMVDVLEKLGYSRTSGTMTKYIKKRIEELQIDTSHFLGQKGNRGVGNKLSYTNEEILIKDSNYSNRTLLKKRLIKSGLIDNVCSECQLSEVWNNKPIVLHLDHINGKYNDNRLINLRLLCPNCHSQTDTYSGKNKEKNNNPKEPRNSRKNILIDSSKTVKIPLGYSNYICKNCNLAYMSKDENSKFCTRLCVRESLRKVVRPTKDELYNMLIDSLTFTEIGESYGITGNTVRKWCKGYGIPYKTSEYKILKSLSK